MPTGQQYLYPPAVESYMPACLKNEKAKVYFSLTRFNNPDDIAHVQATVTRLEDNLSALRILNTVGKTPVSGWPNEVKLCPIHVDNTIGSDYKYYIEIDPLNDLANLGGEFESNQVYKVQLRFSDLDPHGAQGASFNTTYNGVTGLPIFTSDPGATWYTSQIDHFSEWSTVCLIKGISKPIITIKGLAQEDTASSFALDTLGLKWDAYDNFDRDPGAPVDTVSATEFDGTPSPFQALIDALALDSFTGQDDGYGTMMFSGQSSNTDITEVLDTYEAKLYYQDPIKGRVELAATGIKHPDHTYKDGMKYDVSGAVLTTAAGSSFVFSDFHFGFDYILEDLHAYELDFHYVTTSGFQDVEEFTFNTALSSIYFPNLEISPDIDEDNGRMGVNIVTRANDIPVKVTGALVVKRADYRDGFNSWKTIYERAVTNQVLNETIYDYSAESGVFYRYAVNDKTIDTPMMSVYEDIFLVGEDRQLKIQFDPKISSFKQVVQDSKIETLGGKYPFINRNGNVNYKEFQLSGLISAQSDENNLFTDEEEMYLGNGAEFAAYNAERGISSYEDMVKEKAFRDKALDFLYDGKVKLYKSTTEGNSLVRVTDVSLTPVDGLGRMLYSFSATLTEIDAYSIENCRKYGVEISDFDTDLIFMIAATVVATPNGEDVVTTTDWTIPITVLDSDHEASGHNKDLVFIYKRDDSAPTAPSKTVKYNFETSEITGDLDGWSLTIPFPDGRPMYYCIARVTSTGSISAIGTSQWSAPQKRALNIAAVRMYQRSNAGVPALPGPLSYDFDKTRPVTADGYDGKNLSWSDFEALAFDSKFTLEQELQLTTRRYDDGELAEYSQGFMFGEGEFSGATSWVPYDPPAGTETLYCITALVFSNEGSVVIPTSAWYRIAVASATKLEFAQTKIAYIYKEKAGTPPTTPTVNLTYTFATGLDASAVAATGWSVTPPANPVFPVYVTAALINAHAAPLTGVIGSNGWITPMAVGQLRAAYRDTIYLYGRQIGKNIPRGLRKDVRYSFPTDKITGSLDSWTTFHPLEVPGA